MNRNKRNGFISAAEIPIQAIPENITPSKPTQKGDMPRGVQAVPMTITRTARKQVDNKPKVKTVDDLHFNRVEVRWSTDWDIITLHRTVLVYLDGIQERRTILDSTIKACRATNRQLLSTSDIANLRIKIGEMEEELRRLNLISTLDYTSKVKPLLAEYKELSKVIPKIFGEKEKPVDSDNGRKAFVVDEYLAIAQQYCPMDVIREIKANTGCKCCGGLVVDDGEQLKCSECGVSHAKIEVCTEKIESEDSLFKNTANEHSANFRDILSQFRGTYPVVIPDKVLDTIKKAISQYKAFDIRKMTKADLVKIMKENGLGLWYKHLNKIHNLLTGNPLPDMASCAANVEKRGELLAEIYDEIKPEDRSNFIHGLYVIWLFMMNEGCKPNMDDFSLLKSRQTELVNIDTMIRGFDILRKTHPEFEWTIFQIP